MFVSYDDSDKTFSNLTQLKNDIFKFDKSKKTFAKVTSPNDTHTTTSYLHKFTFFKQNLSIQKLLK